MNLSPLVRYSLVEELRGLEGGMWFGRVRFASRSQVSSGDQGKVARRKELAVTLKISFPVNRIRDAVTEW